MLYEVKTFNLKIQETRFERMGRAALDATEAMESIAALIMRIEGQVFESEGRRGGGSWRQDTKAWLLRKQRLNLDPRIGHATLALRESMTIPDDEHQILDITPSSVHLSTDLPYAGTEQRHRPFVKFTPVDRADMRSIIRQHLMDAWRA